MSKSRPVYWMWRAEPLSLPLFSPTEIIPPPPHPDLDAGSEGFSRRSPFLPTRGRRPVPLPTAAPLPPSCASQSAKGCGSRRRGSPWSGATGAGEPERPGQEPGGPGEPHRPAAGIGLPAPARGLGRPQSHRPRAEVAAVTLGPALAQSFQGISAGQRRKEFPPPAPQPGAGLELRNLNFPYCPRGPVGCTPHPPALAHSGAWMGQGGTQNARAGGARGVRHQTLSTSKAKSRCTGTVYGDSVRGHPPPTPQNTTAPELAPAPDPAVGGCCRGREAGVGGKGGEVGWHRGSLRVLVGPCASLQPGPILLPLLRGGAELEGWGHSVRASQCPGWGWGGAGGAVGLLLINYQRCPSCGIEPAAGWGTDLLSQQVRWG